MLMACKMTPLIFAGDAVNVAYPQIPKTLGLMSRLQLHKLGIAGLRQHKFSNNTHLNMYQLIVWSSVPNLSLEHA
jgi:hypothetical protein